MGPDPYLGNHRCNLLELFDQLYKLAWFERFFSIFQNDTFLITNLGDEKVEDSADFQMDASRLKLTRTWLKAVSDIITKTSAEKYDVNTGVLAKKNL